MASPRAVVSAVVAWLVVVAVGSTVVWVVISRAGDGIASTVGPEVPGVVTTPAPTAPAQPSSGGPSTGGPSAGGPPTGRPSSGGPSPQADAPERRTWTGPGGLVTVECRGASIALVASSADAGFAVDPTERGPAEVRVTFEGQGEEGRETQVRASCAGGVPVFTVDARDD